jgi:hypothetical protein
VNGLQNQALPPSTMNFHSYAVELNCELFFLCNLFYKFVLFEEKRMQKKKSLFLSDLFQVFKNKLLFFVCIVDKNIHFMFPSKC